MKLKNVYRAIAKKHGVSVAEVKREMQFAVDAAYVNPNTTALTIPRKGAIPTLDEFIEYCLRESTPRSKYVRCLH